MYMLNPVPMDNYLRKIRESRGWTLDYAAKRAGTSNQHLSRLETGKGRLNVDWIEKFSTIYDVNPSEIISDAMQHKKPVKKSLQPVRAGVMAEALPTFGPDMILVLGQANASMKAVVLNYDEPLGELPRHPNQRGVKNAFYVRIYDDSMEPRYYQGEHAAVNGGVSPIPQTDCLIEMKSGEAYVKRFVKQTKTELICRQLNPAKEWKCPLEDVKTLHAIVGRV